MTSREATATPQVRGLSNPLLVPPNHPLPAAVGIVGAGTIGPDIGYYLKSAIPGLKLVLVDINEEALAAAVKRLAAYVEKGLAKRKITPVQAEDIQQNLTTTTDYGDLAECDWVIEAATENLDLKRQIFSQIEAVVKPNSLITSNTSSLPAERLFSHLTHPGRTTVTHFFAPAFRNPAVEVIEWSQADPGMVLYLRGLFCATGKVPLVTSDALCFMLDRVFDNWCNEAALLLEDATPSEVDSVSSELVHAGPFFVLNLAHGNPIIVETNTLQMEEEGEHYRPAEIFRSTETWETLPPGQTIEVEHNRAAAIRDRMLGILFSQAVDILDREIGTPEDLDLGCVLALGFKKGPLELMNELGAAEVQRILDRFAAERPGMPMPKRPLAEYFSFRRFLLVDEIDGVVVITLRRPQAMNALNDAVTDELLAVIRERENDEEVLGFVITGYGARAFCAGADIGSFPELLGDAQAAAGFARDCSRLLLHLDAMEKPVVAAINGMALG
ncbi:MAG: 3-hydroxyacyl-CoA dehydrogenase NAD-binding domain-containing protein, partial [Planctomycetota bacterium]|nr:3-hydroxyacyl-CoA dehydrogenase NAD-binding domain-containing protein [Planctomycetota bacterium]